MQKSRVSSSSSLHVYFDGEHHQSHNRITVKARTDRQMLMSMYEQGKQILQVAIKKFGDEKSPEAIAAAGGFMAEIAQRFSTGALERQLLKKERDDGLAARAKLAVGSQPPPKRRRVTFKSPEKSGGEVETTVKNQAKKLKQAKDEDQPKKLKQESSTGKQAKGIYKGSSSASGSKGGTLPKASGKADECKGDGSSDTIGIGGSGEIREDTQVETSEKKQPSRASSSKVSDPEHKEEEWLQDVETLVSPPATTMSEQMEAFLRNETRPPPIDLD
jgi:hypothetical protein